MAQFELREFSAGPESDVSGRLVGCRIAESAQIVFAAAETIRCDASLWSLFTVVSAYNRVYCLSSLLPTESVHRE